jgi:uncharacterized membrane protein
MRSSEFWLNKIGIGLLLLGVAFLFKYSIDQGWLTPAIRCVVGLLIGGLLLGLGLRLPARRREFSHVLLGGSIATFYITGFAAFQWYNLVSYPLALTFMIAVTVLAFWLAVRRDAVVLALIGALGGLGTPFLLRTDTAGVVGLMTYIAVLLLGIGAIYLFRGWRSLFWTAFVGAWTVIASGIASADSRFLTLLSDRWVLQLAIGTAALVFWAVPVLREMLRADAPGRWPRPSLGVLAKVLPSTPPDGAPLHAHLGAALTPFIALLATQAVWSLMDRNWGVLFMVAAAVYVLVAAVLRQRHVDGGLAHTHALMSALLLTTGAVLVLHGNVLLLAVAAQALVLHVLAQRLGYRSLAFGGHALFAVVGVWLFNVFNFPAEGRAVIDGDALTYLATIGLTVAVSFMLGRRDGVWVYRLLAHLALLAWLQRELSVLPNGNGYVSVAWGVYAVGLLLAGLRRDHALLRTIAIGTLLLVVAKLFLVDLVEVEAIWRVLLFIGFGVVFLLLSYFFQSLWRPVRADQTD